MADIKYVIEVDDKGTPKLSKFDGELKELERGSKKAESGLGGLWKQFAIGQLAVDALKRGFSLFTGFLKDSVKAAADQEQAEKNLALALGTTGRTVDALLPSFKNFANEIQNQTIYTDDAVLSSLSLMAQLTRLDREGLQRATQGAIGLSSVFGIDLQSATTIVAKAMAGNTAVLSRYGIHVDEAASKETKHAQILNQLGVMYERSKGETNTFSGSLKQLSNMWDEVKESVGNSIVKNEALRNTIKDLTDKVKALAGSNDFKLWLNTVIEGLIKAVEFVGKLAVGVKDLTEKIFGATKANREYDEAQKSLNEALNRAAAAGHDFRGKLQDITKEAGKTKPAINETGNAVTDLSTNFKTTKTIIETLVPQWSRLTINARTFSALVNGETVPAARNLNFVLDKLPTTIQTIPWSGLPKEAKPAIDAVSSMFDGLYNDIASGWGNTIQKWFEGALTFKGLWDSLWQDVKSSFFRVIGEMIAKWTLGFIKELISGAASAGKTITETVGSALKSLGATAGSVANIALKTLSWVSSAANVATAVASILNLFKGAPKQTDVTYWLKFIRDDIKEIRDILFINFWEQIQSIWTKLEEIKSVLLEHVGGTLKEIRDLIRAGGDGTTVPGETIAPKEIVKKLAHVLTKLDTANYHLNKIEGILAGRRHQKSPEIIPSPGIIPGPGPRPEPVMGIATSPIVVHIANVNIPPNYRGDDYIIKLIRQTLRKGRWKIPASAIGGY